MTKDEILRLVSVMEVCEERVEEPVETLAKVLAIETLCSPLHLTFSWPLFASDRNFDASSVKELMIDVSLCCIFEFL